MTDSDLTTALDRAAAPRETRTVLDYIEALKPEIEKSLQSAEGAAILARHYYNAVRFNPTLMQCTPDSLVAALLLSAQVRLEPGPLGHVYLVPYKDSKRDVHNVVWMLGYTGIVELARRGGAVGTRASVLYDNDEFTAPWENEKGLHWQHVPAPEGKRGERVGALVVWREGTERMALHMPADRVAVAVRASKNPRKDELSEQDWYWRKTAVRFARPWLPLTTGAGADAFGAAVAADGAAILGTDVEPTGEAFAVYDAEGES